MQEGWDNFMHVYIHLHSKSAPICAFVKTSMVVLRNFASSCFPLTSSAQGREGPLSPRQKRSSRAEAACLSQWLEGCPLINSQLDAERWSLGSPTGVSQLLKQGKGYGCPCFIAYMNIWYKLQLQQSPSAPCSEEGDAGWPPHFCILLHLGHLQHSNQGTKQAEIC